jgi:DNA invertase Pin-like site-specific DNA recombinase
MAVAETTAVKDADQLVPVAEYVRMSTDQQRYSIDRQSALIQIYAQAHRMRIVRSYADPGRTGLTIRDRPGLSRLIADVLAGAAPFTTVLVYDVSRWGRFQDLDESAYYEFLCKRAGIRVEYCAEQFTEDEAPLFGLLKVLKRAMAAEYSRELGVKVAAGKSRVGALGFRVGGVAGYGLRRMVLEQGTVPGVVLRDRERKSIQTDRITLVCGPPEEVRVVRRIYRDYIYLRKTERQIAIDLNSEGLTCCGRSWTRNIVRSILESEKYIGNNIVGRLSQTLRTRRVVKPPEAWIRCDQAFEQVVSKELFEAASHVRLFNAQRSLSEHDILERLRALLKTQGRLTAKIINAATAVPSTNTLARRFGCLSRAYELIDYVPINRFRRVK